MKLLKIKRVYEPTDDGDGVRILVDRLWPRGINKDKARIDLWLKDISPGTELRKRFHGKPDDWEEFRAAYFAELETDAAQAAAKTLCEHLKQAPVTLLYAARDETRNNAVALRDWLQQARKRNK